MLDLGTSMADLSTLYHPWGVQHPLLSVTPLIQITALPLVVLFKPLVAYNLTFLSSYALTAWTTYLLCYHVTKNRWAAFVGGLIYGFAPTRQVHALGHLAQVVTYWFPLYALSVVRFLERPNWKRGLGAGILLGMASLVNFVHTTHFCFVFTLCWLLYTLIARRKEVFRPAFLWPALFLFGVAAAMTLPLFVSYYVAESSENVHYTVPGGAISGSANLLSFFLPSPQHPLIKAAGLHDLFGSMLAPSVVEAWAYLGVLPLLLALWGLAKERVKLNLWSTYGIASAILALGPFLRIGKHLVILDEIDGFPALIPLPYLLLRLIPYFKWSRTPARIAVGTPMALAVLVSLGVVRLQHWLERRHKRHALWAIATALSALILAEYTFAFPYWTTPAPVPAFYARLAERGGNGAIVDHPLNIGAVGNAGRFARAMYYQTVHERPIAGGKSWRTIEEGRSATRLVHDLVAPPNLAVPDVYDPPADEQRVAWLSEMGFQYLILHKYAPYDLYARNRRPLDQVELEKQHFLALLSDPVYEDEYIVAYPIPAGDLPAPTAPPLTAFSHGWSEPQEDAEGRLYRGLAQEGRIQVYAPQAAAYRLAFDARAPDGPQRVAVWLNGDPVWETTVDREQRHVSPALTVQAGPNELVLRTDVPDQRDQALSLLHLEWLASD
jgi:hypothetical protein